MDWSQVKQTKLNEILEDKELFRELSVLASREVATLVGASVTDSKAVLDQAGKEKIKFAIGLFLKELNDNLMNQRDPKIYLYSGHDTTIIPLMIALGIFDLKWPEYCSNLAIELWDLGAPGVHSAEDSDNVSDLISGDTDETFQVRIVSNGKELKRMTLSAFRALCSEMMPKSKESFDLECSQMPATEREKLEKIGGGGSTF